MPDPSTSHYGMVVREMAEGRVVPLLGAGANLCDRPSDQPWDNSLFGTLGGEPTVRQLSPADEVAFWLKTMEEHGMEHVKEP